MIRSPRPGHTANLFFQGFSFFREMRLDFGPVDSVLDFDRRVFGQKQRFRFALLILPFFEIFFRL